MKYTWLLFYHNNILLAAMTIDINSFGEIEQTLYEIAYEENIDVSDIEMRIKIE